MFYRAAGALAVLAGVALSCAAPTAAQEHSTAAVAQQPDGTAPEGTAPEGTAPEGTAPDGTAPGSTSVVDVFQMSGLVDAIVVDAVVHHLAEAEANGSVGVILQVNSSDVVADGDDYQRLLDEIEAAAVPVGVWIGPSGARAGGEVARLVTVADHSGIAPGASIGPLDDDSPGADDPRLAPIVDRRLGAEDAVAEGVVDDDSPVLGEFVLALEDAGIFPVVSEQVSGDGDLVQRQLAERIRFTKLGLWDQVFHTVASPPVAYLLFLVGLLLILLDFFTGGVGVAGVVGAGSLTPRVLRARRAPRPVVGGGHAGRGDRSPSRSTSRPGCRASGRAVGAVTPHRGIAPSLRRDSLSGGCCGRGSASRSCSW